MADDYFSRLPESLIHRIFSSLPFKEIWRTCVLSKHFNSVWCSYPNLDLVIFYLYNGNLENSLGQCLVRKPFIQQLRLRLHLGAHDLYKLTPNLDGWLGVSVEKNVSTLVLKFPIVHTPVYSVPHQVFLATTLEVLDLRRCTLREDCIVRIELARLEKLLLFECQFVGDNLLQKILCGSPKIKHISLSHCKGLARNSLSVSCTPLLKHFKLTSPFEFKRIKIDVPSLHTFSYEPRNPYSNESRNVACDIDLTTCTNLNELYLCCCVGTLFEQLHSIILRIQVLHLSNCLLNNNNKISSPSLKRLILHTSYRLHDIEIDAPNLQSFEFSMEYYWSSTFKFSSWSIPKANDIQMKFSYYGFLQACNTGLQDFLMKLPNYEDLKLVIYNCEPTGFNFSTIVELHAVSFYSLQEFAKNSRIMILISSRDETNFVHYLSTRGRIISIMCYSWQSAESYCKKLGNWFLVKEKYGHIELVSPAKKQLSSEWESFEKSNSGMKIMLLQPVILL